MGRNVCDRLGSNTETLQTAPSMLVLCSACVQVNLNSVWSGIGLMENNLLGAQHETRLRVEELEDRCAHREAASPRAQHSTPQQYGQQTVQRFGCAPQQHTPVIGHGTCLWADMLLKEVTAQHAWLLLPPQVG